MVQQGTVLTNSAINYRIEFAETNASSNGNKLVLKWVAPANSPKLPAHIHPDQQETFEITKGYLTFVYDGKTTKLGHGERIVLPAGKAHRHYNGETTECEYLQTLEPALDFEDYIVRFNQLVEQRLIKQDGKVSLMEGVISLKKYKGKVYLAAVPIGVQNVVASILAPVAKMMGYGG